MGFRIYANTMDVVPMLDDYATATKEILTAVVSNTAQNFEAMDKKVKAFIVSNTKLMEQLVALLKANANKPSVRAL